MERIAESKALPAKLPVASQVSSRAYIVSGREVSQAPKLQTGLVRDVAGRFNAHQSQITDFPVPVRPWKGKDSAAIEDDLMLDVVVTSKGSGDSFDEGEPSSFSGASHPPEPIDTDLIMKTVYVPISQKKAEPGCLVKSMSVKGPFLEDLSIRVSPKKPSPVILSPAESLIEEPNDFLVLPSPFTVPRRSQNTENSLLPPDSEEKECVWDASLPPSGNVSPHSSIDSTGVVTAMSIVNSCASTYRSDAITSDGMLTIDRNCESTKGSVSVRGDSLESAKTSVSRASDSSGLSDDSNWSNITGSANKPHKGNDPRWNAILAIRARDGILGMSHFRLFKRLGCGDIGSVYLSELSGTRCFFAMKVMDKASLASRKKLTRAQTEREILQLLDHPFLPTLYTHFETDRFSCLVMEYCPGGDLHTLRQRQPGKHFSEHAARFYAAEVLLALEYLHMLGVVYRDLKPENVLVRDDGHIMLSDFDLSLRCAVSPTLIRTSFDSDPSKRAAGGAFCVQPACIEPSSVCIQPACFLPRIFPQKNKKKTRKSRHDLGLPACALPELVAEPTAARSMSFVGTHEYLAPEIIKGEGHGSAVDWWTFGIFLHELLYGKTPFKGSGNRATLFNVVGQQLRFPDSPATAYASQDLIRGLLVKEPQHRLGVKRGATEIKQHPFFESVNWALIRCSTPPEVPRPVETEPSPGKFGAVLPPFQPSSTASPHMSATALLQKAAQMGVTVSKPSPSPANAAILRPHQGHMSDQNPGFGSTLPATSTANPGLFFTSREEMGSGFGHGLASLEDKAATVTSGIMEYLAASDGGGTSLVHDMMSSLSSASGFDGSSFDNEDFNGMLNPKRDSSNFQEILSKSTESRFIRSDTASGSHHGGGNDGLTRDFLGLKAFPHKDFLNLPAGFDHISPSTYGQRNQNLPPPWQGSSMDFQLYNKK